MISILSFLFLAIGFNNVTGIQYAIPTNNQKIFTISVIVGAISNFILNLCLISTLKSIGAAIASVFAETIIFIIQIIFFRHQFNFKEIVKSNIHYFYCSILLFFVVLFIGNYLHSGILATLVQIICGILFYIVILLFRKDSLLLELIQAIKQKIGGKYERRTKKDIEENH